MRAGGETSWPDILHFYRFWLGFLFRLSWVHDDHNDTKSEREIKKRVNENKKVKVFRYFAFLQILIGILVPPPLSPANTTHPGILLQFQTECKQRYGDFCWDILFSTYIIYQSQGMIDAKTYSYLFHWNKWQQKYDQSFRDSKSAWYILYCCQRRCF